MLPSPPLCRLRLLSGCLLLAFLLLASVLPTSHAETILIDSCGQGIQLPTTGGNATTTMAIRGPLRATSPYILQIAVNDGVGFNSIGGEQESFFISSASFQDAHLLSQVYNPNNDIFLGNTSGIEGDWLGNATNPNGLVGLYTYTFIIPVGGTLELNLTYQNSGMDPLTVIDWVTIVIVNPVLDDASPGGGVGGDPDPPTIVGDPQFIGLRGQSYQVHGIDGAVYNLITEQRSQVNSRFVFLTHGRCPVRDGLQDSNCWTHPGSYLGELSFQQVVSGSVHRALVQSGAADVGFSLVSVDGSILSVGQRLYISSAFSLHYRDSHTLTVQLEHFNFILSNSDHFINQGVIPKLSLSLLTSHGLMGQTHSETVYARSPIPYIQGRVDDYVLESDDIFGTDFVFNLFQVSSDTQ